MVRLSNQVPGHEAPEAPAGQRLCIFEVTLWYGAIDVNSSISRIKSLAQPRPETVQRFIDLDILTPAERLQLCRTLHNGYANGEFKFRICFTSMDYHATRTLRDTMLRSTSPMDTGRTSRGVAAGIDNWWARRQQAHLMPLNPFAGLFVPSQLPTMQAMGSYMQPFHAQPAPVPTTYMQPPAQYLPAPVPTTYMQPPAQFRPAPAPRTHMQPPLQFRPALVPTTYMEPERRTQVEAWINALQPDSRPGDSSNRTDQIRGLPSWRNREPASVYNSPEPPCRIRPSPTPPLTNSQPESSGSWDLPLRTPPDSQSGSYDPVQRPGPGELRADTSTHQDSAGSLLQSVPLTRPQDRPRSVLPQPPEITRPQDRPAPPALHPNWYLRTSPPVESVARPLPQPFPTTRSQGQMPGLELPRAALYSRSDPIAWLPAVPATNTSPVYQTVAATGQDDESEKDLYNSPPAQKDAIIPIQGPCRNRFWNESDPLWTGPRCSDMCRSPCLGPKGCQARFVGEGYYDELFKTPRPYRYVPPSQSTFSYASIPPLRPDGVPARPAAAAPVSRFRGLWRDPIWNPEVLAADQNDI